jgi:cell wall-associated NlpC family hydrolase
MLAVLVAAAEVGGLMGRAGIASAAGAAIAALLAVVLLIVGIGSSTQAISGASVGMACAPDGWTPGQPLEGFGPRELANAGAIVQVGAEMGMPQRAQVIAVATAARESRLLVLGNPTVAGSMQPPPQGVGHDHDSVGLFQQRGTGWGPLAVRMDPRGSARLFYERLRQVPGWERLPLTQAADAVQHSALPHAYEQWEPAARRIVGAVSGVSCGPAPGAGAAPDGSLAAAVATRALSQVGIPYVWGGGDAQGPTAGAPGVRAPKGGGFDCSGLMVFAFAGIGVDVPHQTQAIWTAFAPPITDRRLLQPGDMLLFSDNGQPSGIHHVGLYLGGEGRFLHAPRTGLPVTVVDNLWQSAYYSRQFIGAVRAVPAAAPRPAPAGARVLP